MLSRLSTLRSGNKGGAAALPFVVWRQHHLVLSSARGRRNPSVSATHRVRQRWFESSISGVLRSFSSAAANAGPSRSDAAPISPSSSSSSDVLIVGGGAVGAALARWIGMRLPDWSVMLVEGGPGPSPTTDAASDAAAPAGHESHPHPRSYALSPSALDVLGLTTGGHPHRRHPRLGYYDSMQIWESSQPATVCFDKSDVPPLEHLGAVVEDSVIVRHLWNDLRETVPQCELRTHTLLSRLLGPLSPSSLVEVELIRDDGRGTTTRHTHRTRLLVAADGAHSKVRQLAGLGQVSLDYGQTALTLTVQVDGSLRGRCFQRFLPTGPLALLPTFSDDHAIVVWSTTPDVVQQWKDHPGLIEHLNELFQQGPGTLQPLFPSAGGGTAATSGTLPAPLADLLYGAEKLLETLPYGLAMAAASQPFSFTLPPMLVQATSSQLSFPLHLRHSAAYAASRVVLVGDAAHTVHPFAGQGLNLGLQDVSSLGKALEDAHAAGMDPGIAVPQQYDGDRRTTVAATLAGLHTLQRLFALQPAPVKHLKAIGMGAIQTVPTFRKVLAEIACFGSVGRGGGRGGD